MRRLVLCRRARRLLGRRLDPAAGGRCRRGRGGRRRRRGGSGWWGRAGRAGTWDMAGALVSLNQLDDAVDDQRDQDHDKQNPADQQHGLVVPGGGLGFLVERVDGFGRLEVFGQSFWPDGCRGSARWRMSAHAIVGMLGRLIVEVVRWAVACHGTDGTDTTCQTAGALNAGPGVSARLAGSERVDLVDADESSWEFTDSSCDGCAIKQQVNGLIVLATGSLGKFCCCGPVRSQGSARRRGCSLRYALGRAVGD
jgi:hypothetical protein